MPEQDAQLAGNGDRRDLMAAAGADAFVKRSHWAGGTDCEQCRFGEGVAHGAGPAFADPAVVSGFAAGLADLRVKPEVTDELSG
jgi:hypothetical protein